MVSQKDAPVENIVEDVEPGLVCSLSDQVLEQDEVGSFFKAECHYVIHVLSELSGATLAQFFVWVLFLELANFAVSGRMLRDGNTLPRQIALDQIYHDVAQSDQVISP